MQATLEDVELSASGGTHVFGPGHDRKLHELRFAQIGLAQAWARSEADESIGTSPRDNEIPLPAAELRNLRNTFMEPYKSSVAEETEQARSIDKPPGEGFESNNDKFGSFGSNVIGETEIDIVLGRKRREANDRYFQRVNDGVIDVVARLEHVTVAMRAVEQESQDIWNESKCH
ncbi:hypothetical protein NOR_02996 [Metarhizium rileyi]|uniref:Uncharacterized protein n=1 Tax=Metarhizium rileyi (strain RCEF 4871) TaxID=1649241 RepID=A0A162JRS5_METRR|nr:hypothetical protein NOR_02996 [Metarhizium rileyi RCEF 4871]